MRMTTGLTAHESPREFDSMMLSTAKSLFV
jgi:hypothetical protein